TVLSATAAFEVGNLNGDAFPDLVNLAVPGVVGVHLGNGAGFTLSQTIPFAPQSPSRINLADVNGDGIQDIVLVDGSGTLSFLRARGGGSFAPAVSIGAGSGIQPFGPLSTPIGALAIGDVNNDGRDDIAFFGGVSTASSVRLMLGSASTLLQPSTVIASV